MTTTFILKAIAIYIIILGIRYASLELVLPKNKFNKKEKLFMTLLTPKGIAVAVVVLSILVIPLEGYETALLTISQLIVLEMIFSLITSTIIGRFDNYFLKRLHDEEAKLKKDTKKLASEKKKIEKELEQKEKVLNKIKSK
jgi:NhaP-type Na+/H+ or K+/H+ antiporter